MQAASTRKRDFQILRGNGDEILRDGLLRIGVNRAAELRVDSGDLIGAQTRASAKGHVLLRVGHSGKARRRILPPCEIILLDSRNRRQRIAHNYNAESVIERCAEYGLVRIVRRQTDQQD